MTQARTAIAQAKFLAAFAQRGVVRHAAVVAEVTRFSVYAWIRDDPAFKEKFDEAREDAIDRLELEARRRAEDGWLEEVHQGGKLVGHIRRYDGALMALLLKGRRGDIFRERVSSEIDARVRAETNPLSWTDRELEDKILAEAVAITTRRQVVEPRS